AALYFVAPEPKTAEEKARDRVRDDVYGYEENYKQKHLWKVGVSTRAETRITGGDFSVTSYDLSDDGRKIVYHRQPTPLLGDGPEGEVWTANPDGSGAVQVTKNQVPESGAKLSPDSSLVLFISGSNPTFESYYNGRLFVASANGGEARVVAGEKEPIDVDSAVWAADGKSIYFLGNVGVHE